MDGMSEADLLAGCRRGEPGAWEALFDRHYGATIAFLYQLGFSYSREDVEELCQEVFLSVIRNLESFQGQAQFQTWLFRIAINKARDHRQRQRAGKRGAGALPLSLDREDPMTGLKLDPPSKALGPDRELIRQENIHLVGQALQELGGPCQEIIELRYFADLSYEEISEALRLNPKTVSSRLSKCLDKLGLLVEKLIPRERKTSTPV